MITSFKINLFAILKSPFVLFLDKILTWIFQYIQVTDVSVCNIFVIVMQFSCSNKKVCFPTFLYLK